MQSNIRIYIRCVHRVLIEKNIIVVLYNYVKKIIEINYELLNKTNKISANLEESKAKLQKARTIIENSTSSNQTNFFNLVK